MLRNVDSLAFCAKTPAQIAETIDNEGFLAYEALYEYIFPSKWEHLFQDTTIEQITYISLDSVGKLLCHHIDIAYKDNSALQNRLVHYWIDNQSFILRKYVYEVDYDGSHQYVEQHMKDIQANPYFLANERILRPINKFNTQIPRGYKSSETPLGEMTKPVVEIDTMAAIIAKDSGIVAQVVMLDSAKIDTIKLNLPSVLPITEINLPIAPILPITEIKKDTIIRTIVVPKVVLSPLQKGESAPNFTLTTAEGGTISLKDLQNKVVLINFWDRSCDTCINILPVLQNLQNRYADRGFVVLELYTSEAVKDTFHTLSNVKYKIGLNAQQVAAEYHVQKYPTLYLIDKEGKIFEVATGRVAIKEEEWNGKIEACLVK